MLKGIPTVKTIADLTSVSRPLTFADAQVSAVEPPLGFEVLSTAIAERCAITIVYEQGWQRPTPRMITPRLVLEAKGMATWWPTVISTNVRRPFGWIGSGVLARIGDVESEAKIIDGEQMGTLGTVALGGSAVMFDATHAKVLLTPCADNDWRHLPDGRSKACERVVETCMRAVLEETGSQVRSVR